LYLTLINRFGNIAVVNVATAHYNTKYSVETLRGFYTQRRHKMSKLLKQFTQLFATKTTRLEEFLASKSIKTHADVEYWSRHFESRGF